MTPATLNTPKISAGRAAEILGQPVMTTMRWATYEFGLKLLSPMLIDRMTQAQILGLITGQKVDFAKDEPLEDKARRKIYSDAYDDNDMPSGDVGIPRENLYAALRDAGEVVQYGSGKHDRITLSSKGTMLYTMIRIHEPFLPVLGLDGKPAAWEIDLRKGNATQGNGAVGIIRARFDEGGFVGHVDVNLDLLRPEKASELFTVAGIKQGLCSARPSKKMPFGQFALTHFKWVGGADPSKSATARTSNNNGGTKPGKKTKGRNRIAGNGHPEGNDNDES